MASSLCDELRAFWLTGIHEVSGRPSTTLVGLIAEKNFQIYRPISRTTATLTFVDWDPIVRAMAADCGRFGSAAIETAVGITPTKTLPKSLGWLIVRAYYAGFFSAQAILRMIGRSVTQLDATAVNGIDSVASLFGMQPTEVSLEKGLYVCQVDEATKSIHLAKAADSSHESLWVLFTQELRRLIAEILKSSPSAKSAQEAASKLTELQFALTDNNSSPTGKWMSAYRNRVNYQQAHGMWFPYEAYQGYYEGLTKNLELWRKGHESIRVWPDAGRDAQRFVEVSAFLISLCRELSVDMCSRCSEGPSFLQYSTIGCMRQAKVA